MIRMRTSDSNDNNDDSNNNNNNNDSKKNCTDDSKGMEQVHGTRTRDEDDEGQ